MRKRMGKEEGDDGDEDDLDDDDGGGGDDDDAAWRQLMRAAVGPARMARSRCTSWGRPTS